MRTIRISDEVWNAMAERGKFGETPDDVLRRLFQIEPVDKANQRKRMATRRMTTKIDDGQLSVAFANGPQRKWRLPLKDNKRELRTVRDAAVAFAGQNGATEGQLKALIKAMTSAGYHLTK
ncbi:MAG: hypothetical protein ACE5IW_08165 [bacterium]